jgi:hypothetical protein
METGLDNSQSEPGWLPARLTQHGGRPQLEWVWFGRDPLHEPFFSESVERRLRVSGLGALDSVHAEMRLAGFIFHVSRCGSTLVANALRAWQDVAVLSEAQPINSFLRLGVPAGARPKAFGKLLAAYCQRRNSCVDLVIKLTSWNVLWLDLFRKVWPTVPCILIVRNPVEVMVSCLDKHPGWLHMALDPKDLGPETLPIEETAARTLARFMDTAVAHAGEGLRVVDYADLNEAVVVSIAGHFGLAERPVDLDMLRLQLNTNAKDPNRTQRFVPDAAAKRDRATDQIRAAAARWAEPAYTRLLSQRPL